MQTPLREFQHPVGVLLPGFAAILRDGDTGRPLDLTAYTAVNFLLVDISGSPIVVNNAAAVFEDKPNGKVRYDFQTADVAIARRCHAWFILTDASMPAKTEEFPVGQKLVLEFV